ncbi:class I SAM-dependent methyltransferase [Bacillus shivajii]|uniref:class I SAM-dependent DNA methyltransferase n=1 Tax=Bacillus shivajii TaxID=1983719 RepID=UPI001CF93B9E|nr:class I SAM-dependent methyltransferase [Bacillus shivajii]UCZ54464.1 class I SAM-dependent methyltransferase [Bacillus shivajii]
MAYEQFASLYDILMEDAPYDRWITYTEKYLRKGASILDVGCGTGTFTMMLQEAGYKLSGSDLSNEMLAIAEKKAREKKLQIPFVCQDMRSLSGFHDLDGVTLFCDGLNYLKSENDVKQTFERVYSTLKEGGTFLFDVHSTYKVEEIFYDQLFGENHEDLSYMWYCTPGEEPYSVEHTLTFFVQREDGLYERFDEDHQQKTYPVASYVKWLEASGFSDIEISGEFGDEKVENDHDRIFFKAVKI